MFSLFMSTWVICWPIDQFTNAVITDPERQHRNAPGHNYPSEGCRMPTRKHFAVLLLRSNGPATGICAGRREYITTGSWNDQMMCKLASQLWEAKLSILLSDGLLPACLSFPGDSSPIKPRYNAFFHSPNNWGLRIWNQLVRASSRTRREDNCR